MIEFLADMKKQKNKQLQLVPIDANANNFRISGKYVTVTENGTKVRYNIYIFSKGFTFFVTNKDVTERDKKHGDEKIEQILRYID